MCLNEICRDLTAVNETVSQWCAGEPVSDIEKDMALEKLRDVYSRIKSMQPGDVYSNGADFCADDSAEDVGGEPEGAPSENGDDAPVDFQCATPVDFQCATPVDGASCGDMPDASPCETGSMLSDAVKKRKALLSLYDQETEEENDEMPPAPAAHIAKTDRHTFISGETGNAGEQTLGEAYAQHRKPHDIKSAINCGRIETLSVAIGINDKFLMIRDMFEGDAGAYDAAMRKFESFRDLDDAMVYIYENYNWDPDCDGVTLLVDLLTRKLS